MIDAMKRISRHARRRTNKVFKHWSRRLDRIDNARCDKRRALAGK